MRWTTWNAHAGCPKTYSVAAFLGGDIEQLEQWARSGVTIAPICFAGLKRARDERLHEYHFDKGLFPADVCDAVTKRTLEVYKRMMQVRHETYANWPEHPVTDYVAQYR